jgi:hypothetical protein
MLLKKRERVRGGGVDERGSMSSCGEGNMSSRKEGGYEFTQGRGYEFVSGRQYSTSGRNLFFIF